ncbi:transposase [Enterococcus sp. DIV0806c]|uniref:transposase n=1 Tax=Enterococcus sp. DIV0806c TaxID=2774869 RepID=UPI003F684895
MKAVKSLIYVPISLATPVNIQYIIMDTNAPYFELAKSIIPHVQIVTDRFHII